MTILEEMRRGLGLPVSEDSFDTEILTYLNGSMLTLDQIGIKVKTEVGIETDWNEWIDEENMARLSAVKRIVLLGLILEIDPPNGNVAEAYRQTINELQSRLC